MALGVSNCVDTSKTCRHRERPVPSVSDTFIIIIFGILHPIIRASGARACMCVCVIDV